jgi:hypothetical protein
MTLSKFPWRSACLKSALSLLQLLHILTFDSFFRLYISGILVEGHCVVQLVQTQTPQLRQWPALLNIAKFFKQMKQFGVFEKGIIFGGALAMADSRACRSVGNEKALRNFEAVFGSVATPF